jgi:glycosyltransferase involved in cell wall biosynthesis
MTMKLPRISIVTLSFNQGRYLASAIDSVLGQNYPNLDHIVVDPGSTDNSRTTIARYAGKLTALLEPDAGPADGLNRGFAAATGEIFGYINADDLMLPGALDTVARHFTANPDIDAILGNGLLIDASGNVRRRIGSSRYSLKSFGHGAMTFCQQGHYFRRTAFEAVGGFNAANRTSWDAELLVDMGVAGARVLNVPERLGCFRLYGETITGSDRMAEAMARDLARITAKALGRPPVASDPMARSLHLMLRRLSDPAAAIEGLRARIAGHPMD